MSEMSRPLIPDAPEIAPASPVKIGPNLVKSGQTFIPGLDWQEGCGHSVFCGAVRD